MTARELLQLPSSKLQDVIEFLKRFPSIHMSNDVRDGDDIRAGDNVTVQVTFSMTKFIILSLYDFRNLNPSI